MTNLKAAVIGAGFVGRAHVDALRRLNVPILGLLDNTPERTRQLNEQLGLPRDYASLEQLASDDAVDVVHVCTPNYLHFEQCSTLLRAGKHVICEKPLATTSAECAKLVDLCGTTGRLGAVSYNLRYYPMCQEAKAIIASGAIGEPRLVHGGFLQDWLLYPTDWNWRLEPELGGELRAVADIGTHWLDLVTWLIERKITAICADLATVVRCRFKPRGLVETFQAAQASNADEVTIRTDDYASLLLHFQHDIRGVMTVSQVSAGRKAHLSFEVDGSEGSLAWNSESPNELWIGSRKQANQLLTKDPSMMHPATRHFASFPGGHQEGYGDTFYQFFREFYEYVASDRSTTARFPSFETGHEKVLLCESILRSQRDRRWVALD